MGFSRFTDLGVAEYSNGRTWVVSTFTAENQPGMSAKYQIDCLLDASGVLESEIQQVAQYRGRRLLGIGPKLDS